MLKLKTRPKTLYRSDFCAVETSSHPRWVVFFWIYKGTESWLTVQGTIELILFALEMREDPPDAVNCSTLNRNPSFEMTAIRQSSECTDIAQACIRALLE